MLVEPEKTINHPLERNKNTQLQRRSSESDCVRASECGIDADVCDSDHAVDDVCCSTAVQKSRGGKYYG